MSVRKFQDGETAIIADTYPGYDQRYHNAIPGTEVTIRNTIYKGYSVIFPSGKLGNVSTKYLLKSEHKSSITKFEKLIEDAESKIERTKAFIAETKAKIDFMKEVGTEMFDENEFKAFHTLTIIEQGNMSKIEKAKAIAALISKK